MVCCRFISVLVGKGSLLVVCCRFISGLVGIAHSGVL